MSVCPHTPQKRMRGGYKDMHLVFRGDGMNADGARSLFNDVIREEGQHDNRDFGQVGEKDGSRLESVHDGHLKVEDNEMRLEDYGLSRARRRIFSAK
jgi:hypothetical protein